MTTGASSVLPSAPRRPLLALFFTTVGVIASTAYARVPGEIRSLFVRERTSLIYVWNVAVALLVGLALLTMPLVAHRWPHGLTVLLFAVLTAFSVLSLVVLGTRLFNFFDLSTLSLPLRHRFLRGVTAPHRRLADRSHARPSSRQHMTGRPWSCGSTASSPT